LEVWHGQNQARTFGPEGYLATDLIKSNGGDTEWDCVKTCANGRAEDANVR